MIKKEECPDPSVHLYFKLFDGDIRSRDVTDKVQDILHSNLRRFVRNQLLNRLKDLTGENPQYRLPL
ncbi:unnamed protein product [Rotaria sp. Silwood2]|nr:unnamed protein product [Rotaria sp. Silwood2]CAF3480119.1 unnamed protein product [Rotaria sp. Silwood2]CAF4088068.1 unnamed protein product [Rotaria sp. Silwood2]CAF4650049.1 unnamed protein product [Rotaria sp. Silwood2]